MPENVSLFYFAWVGADEVAFTGDHMREDELIFSFKLVHDEGQFATLDLEIRNPRIGLLAPGRALWAWFSWFDGTNVTPIFFGRIVGIPTDLFAEVITISLIGKPVDYVDQRQGVADGLNFLPFVDPIFLDPTLQTDPDTVLEAYSALWHVDRTTGLVTTSDMIVGEDGIDAFTSDEAFYDSVKIQIGQTPLTEIDVTATVGWHQIGGGSIDIGTSSFTSNTNGLLADWPKIGDDLQGGYSVVASSLIETSNGIVIDLSSDGSASDAAAAVAASDATDPTLDPVAQGQAVVAAAIAAAQSGNLSAGKPTSKASFNVTWNWQNTEKTHEDGDTMSVQGTAQGILAGQMANFQQSFTIGDPYTGTAAASSISYDVVGPESTSSQPVNNNPANPDAGSTADIGDAAIVYNASLTIGMNMDQQRLETLNLTVTSNLQPILTEPDEKSITESLTFNINDVVAAGALDASAGAYFATDRGTQSIEYLILIARAHLLASSRAVQVSWDCSFPRLLGMSCRMNASLQDDRLPGGVVLGKVSSYGMDGNGDIGEFIGHVTISSAVGFGGAVATDSGTPDYVDSGYETGYQYHSGQFVAVNTGDITFELPAYPNVGLQNPLTPDQVLVRIQWFPGDVSNDPYVQIELKPITGINTSIEYNIATSVLEAPQQIDLAAASTV